MRDAGAPPSWERDLADPLEIRSSPTCYHNKFRHYMPNHFGVRRGPKICWDAGPRPLGLWVAKPVKTCSFPHVSPCNFHDSRSNRLSIRRGSQKFGEAGALPPWDVGVTDTLEICSPTCLPSKIRSF